MSERVLHRAEIIAVGTELLGADRTDTNSLFITNVLNDLGIDVVAKAVVGDHFHNLAAVFRDALARADLVILTGGLGPTDDDLTRDAVAHVLGRPLNEHAPVVDRIRERFASRGLTMPDINRRQALVIEGAQLLENRHGTAPGQWMDADECMVVLLPGPPREMQPMVERVAHDVLASRTAGARVFRRSVRLAGRSESQVEEMLQPLYRAWAAYTPTVAATILAAQGMLELQLRVTTRSAQEAEDTLQRAAEQVAERFGPDVISTTGVPLEQVVGELLRKHGQRLGVAESCTGGLVSARLTDVAGSSDYFEEGVVTYSNRAKVDVLGVSNDLIAEHGAVSEPVAVAMARNVRRVAHADVGLAITGIAGPGGGSESKPVGTVVIAVDGPASKQFVRTFSFVGSRAMVRTFASTTALDRLRRVLREE